MIIYSDINKEDYYTKAKVALTDQLLDGDIDEITKEDIEDYVKQDMEEDWRNLVLGCLVGNIKIQKCVALGSIGRWDGTYGGWTVIKDNEDLYNLLKDCNLIEVEDREGRVIVTGIHHDGTNQYELMLFTDEGYDFYMGHDELTNKEMLNALLENKYIVAPNIKWDY